jgi:hypothetical protein
MNSQRNRYRKAIVGRKDRFLYPMIRPGAIITVDTHQRAIASHKGNTQPSRAKKPILVFFIAPSLQYSFYCWGRKLEMQSAVMWPLYTTFCLLRPYPKNIYPKSFGVTPSTGAVAGAEQTVLDVKAWGRSLRKCQLFGEDREGN